MNEHNFDIDENYTVISQGVVIRGDIESTSAMNIAGRIEGNISCAGDLELGNKAEILGDIQSTSISINGANIRGNVTVQDRFVLDKDSMIEGSLTAQSARINGRIDGPVTVAGEVSIASGAVVMGDLTSASLVVENGAQLKGHYAVYQQPSHVQEPVERPQYSEPEYPNLDNIPTFEMEDSL